MPSKPKPSQTAAGKVIVPNNKAKSTTYTQKSLKQKQKSFKFTNSKRKTTTYGDI